MSIRHAPFRLRASAEAPTILPGKTNSSTNIHSATVNFAKALQALAEPEKKLSEERRTGLILQAACRPGARSQSSGKFPLPPQSPCHDRSGIRFHPRPSAFFFFFPKPLRAPGGTRSQTYQKNPQR